MKRYLIAFFLLQFTLVFAAVDVSIKVQDQIQFAGQNLNEKENCIDQLLKETLKTVLPQVSKTEVPPFFSILVHNSKQFIVPIKLFYWRASVDSNFIFKEILGAILFPKHYFF
ncbi:MAG: hypothetical protein WBN28_04165 [Lutimonas sp.]